MSNKEILTIHVHITGAEEVKGTTAEALMIYFDGECNSEIFQGKVLPGGIDTQKQWYGEPRTLSARYILAGTDLTGQNCRIFIENNGCLNENGDFITTPKIITNSQALSFLETSRLSGIVECLENGVIIHIFQEN
mgnify:CR=1 FL=1